MSSHAYQDGDGSVGELLAETVALYLRNFNFLLILAAAVWVPILVLELLIGLALGVPNQLQAVQPNHPEANQTAALTVGLYTVAVIALSLCAVVLSQAALVKAAADRASNHPLTYADALRAARARFLPLLGLLAVLFVLLVGAEIVLFVAGLLVIFIAGFVGGLVGGSVQATLIAVVIVAGAMLPLIVFARIQASVPLVVLEELAPIAALRRALDLQRYRYWPSLFLLLAVSFIGWFVSAVTGLVIGSLSGSGGPTSQLALNTLGAVVTSAVFGPLPPVAMTVIYFDAIRLHEATPGVSQPAN